MPFGAPAPDTYSCMFPAPRRHDDAEISASIEVPLPVAVANREWTQYLLDAFYAARPAASDEFAGGNVRFEALGEDASTLTVELQVEPEPGSGAEAEIAAARERLERSLAGFRSYLQRRNEQARRSLISASIEVDIPIRFADREWTEFVWRTFAGYYTMPVDQLLRPLAGDESDAENGSVYFETKGERLTKVRAEVAYVPRNRDEVEQEEARVRARLQRDLEAFRAFLLARCDETRCRTVWQEVSEVAPPPPIPSDGESPAESLARSIHTPTSRP